MIKEIAQRIKSIISEAESSPENSPGVKDKKIIILDPEALGAVEETEVSLNTLGLFADVAEDKVAEIIHAMLYLDKANSAKKKKDKEVIEFYISTYGGSADDMFGLYDVMRDIKSRNTLSTVGVGKVMSAGVLLLAGGTNGKRKIGKNCRIMIHSVIGGNHGSLHNMMNEMEAIEQMQEMYINCLAEETNMSKSQIKKLLERKVNVYLSAQEAVELGIADIII